MVADVERGGRALFPPSIDELLHLDHGSRFFVRVVEGLDQSKLKAEYLPNLGRTRYTPSVLLTLWIYGYVNSASSSRKLKEATWLMVESDKQDEADSAAGDATLSSSDIVDAEGMPCWMTRSRKRRKFNRLTNAYTALA